MEDIEQHLTNFPTDEYFEQEKKESKETAMQSIKKLYRKRITIDGNTQYYVSFKQYPSKKDRVWVNEEDMSPALQQYAKGRKLQVTKANLNMLNSSS